MQIGNQPGKIQDVGCGQNTIINNHIHHCTQIHGDGGGVYTLGGIQTGTVISGNHIHDIHQPVWDRYHVDHIYLDNFSSKITVKDNVVNGGKAVERNGSKGNSLSNNTQSNPPLKRTPASSPTTRPGRSDGDRERGFVTDASLYGHRLGNCGICSARVCRGRSAGRIIIKPRRSAAAITRSVFATGFVTQWNDVHRPCRQTSGSSYPARRDRSFQAFASSASMNRSVCGSNVSSRSIHRVMLFRWHTSTFLKSDVMRHRCGSDVHFSLSYSMTDGRARQGWIGRSAKPFATAAMSG